MGVYNYLKTNWVTVFFSVLLFYPSVRLLTVGAGHTTGFSVVVGLIPELLFMLILAGSLFFVAKDKTRKTHLFDKIVLIYFLYNVLVGFYLSHDLKASLYGFRLTYLPMLAYFVGSYYWDKKLDLERLLHGFFKMLVLIAVLGIIIAFIFPEVHLYFHKIGNGNKPIVMAFSGFMRMTSILWTPVVFGMIMLCAFCYWTYRYFKTGNRFALIYSLITVNTVFLSVSRGPMIASFIVLVILLFFGKNRKFKMILIGLFLLEFLVLFLFIPQFSQLMEWIMISSKQTATLQATNTRVSLWGEVISSIKHNPMGLGLGKAGHAAVQLFPPNTPGVSLASTDGWYFKLMIETGVPALILYLGMALLFFIQMIRDLRKNTLSFVSVIFVIFVASGLVNVVSNALDFYLFNYFYWLLLGLYVMKLKQESK